MTSKTNISPSGKAGVQRGVHHRVPDTVGLRTYPRHSHKVRIKDLRASRDEKTVPEAGSQEMQNYFQTYILSPEEWK